MVATSSNSCGTPCMAEYILINTNGIRLIVSAPIIVGFTHAIPSSAVVPVSPDFNAYAQKVADFLGAASIRAKAYTDDDNMKSKIKVISSEHKTPYILVVGAKEQEEETVTCRFRFSSQIPQRTFKLSEFRDYVLDKVATHFNGI